jgi:hypothetical protein
MTDDLDPLRATTRGGCRFEALQPTRPEDLQAGDIGLGPIAGRVGRGISFAQWWIGDESRFQHAWLCLGMQGGVPLLIEAMPRGARVVRLGADRLSPGRGFVRPALTDDQRGQIYDLARDHHEGRRYGYSDYAWIAMWHRGFRPGWFEHYIQNNGREMCSQLVVQILYDLTPSFPIFWDRYPQLVTPGALAYASDPRVIYTPQATVANPVTQ